MNQEALYQGLDSPEHKKWKDHRTMISHVPGREVGFRGCLGLAMLIDQLTEASWTSEGDLLFLPNDTVRWASLLDVPRGQIPGSRRETHWASIRQASVRHGMPILARGTEGNEAWDFRAVPHSEIPVESERGRFVKRAGPTVLPPDRTQEFRVFNAIELAMTTAAFMGRHTWQAAKAQAKPPAGLVCGQGDIWETPPRPSVWMPRACLGFALEDEHDLFEMCTTVKGMRHIPDGLLLEFWRALTADQEGLLLAYRAQRPGKVIAIRREDYANMPCVAITLSTQTGERTIRFHRSAEIRVRPGSSFEQGAILGHERLELPENCSPDRPLVAIRERHLPRLFGHNLFANLRIWFERQMQFVFEGYIHLDSRLANRAAMAKSVPEALMWEVSACQPFFNIDAQAFIFPPLPTHRWDMFVGVLPGDIAFDLTPPQFFEAEQRKQQEIQERKTRGKRGARCKDQKRFTEKVAPDLDPNAKPAEPRLSKGERRRQRRDAAIMSQVRRLPIAALPEPEVEIVAERRHANEIADRIEERTGTPSYPDLTDEELDAQFGAPEMLPEPVAEPEPEQEPEIVDQSMTETVVDVPAVQPAPTAVAAIVAAPEEVRMSRSARRRAAKAAKRSTAPIDELREEAWDNQAQVQQNDGEPLPQVEIAEDYAAMYADGSD